MSAFLSTGDTDCRPIAWLAVVLLAISLGASGCQDSTATLGSPQAVVSAQGSNIFPSETAQEWVTYSTHVIQATVVTEEELPLEEHEQEHQDGYIGRSATLRVDEVLWDSPYSDVQMPKTIDLNLMGWALNDGERRPMAMVNSPRMEVGGTYVVPLSLGPEGEGAWIVLSFDVVFPVVDGIVRPVRIPDGDESGVDYVSARVDGQPAAFITDLLADSDIDPRAEPFMDLSPYERVQAVVG